MTAPTLHRRIGGHARSEVWTARAADGADVVVKLHGEERRASAEAAALAAVGGPPAPSLLGRTTIGGRYGLVLERVPGTRLDRLDLPTGAEGVATVAALVGTMARAVAAVHAAGWIHGDITPANVLVGPAGEVHLVDFDAAHPPGTRPARATPGYAAPEVAAGMPSTPAADVHSVAVTCLALLDAVADPPRGTADLRHLLREAAADAPAERPTPAALADLAEAVASSGGRTGYAGAREDSVDRGTAPQARTLDLPWPAPHEDEATPAPSAASPLPRWPVVAAGATLIAGTAALLGLPPPLRWPTIAMQAGPVVTLLGVALGQSTSAGPEPPASVRSTTRASSRATNGFRR